MSKINEQTKLQFDKNSMTVGELKDALEEQGIIAYLTDLTDNVFCMSSEEDNVDEIGNELVKDLTEKGIGIDYLVHCGMLLR